MPRARKTETKAAKSVLKVTRTLYGRDPEEDVIEGEVEKFETDPAFVTVGTSVTKQTAPYESLRLEVRLSVPCYKEDLDEQFDRTASAVVEKLDAELDKYIDGGDTGEEEDLDDEDEADTGDEDEDEDEVEDDEEEESDTDDEEDDDEDDEDDQEDDDEDLEEDDEEDEDDEEEDDEEEEAPPPKRERGRPRTRPQSNPRSTRRTAARQSRGRRR